MISNASELVIIGILAIIDGKTRTAPVEAEVRVLKNEKLINMTVADGSGKFIVRLPKNSGKHVLEFAGDDFISQKIEVVAGESKQNLGVIGLPSA